MCHTGKIWEVGYNNTKLIKLMVVWIINKKTQFLT